MFDSTKTFSFTLPHDGADKTCKVRWPSDEEFCQRANSLKRIRRSLGRDKYLTETPNLGKVNLDLFQKIRLDEGPEFDEAEASRVIGGLVFTEPLDSERDGNLYRIRLLVCGEKETEHVLRIPKQSAVMEYASASYKPVDGRREQEIREHLEPAARLYDPVAQSVTGYAGTLPGSVPIIHKEAVCLELLLLVQSNIKVESPEA